MEFTDTPEFKAEVAAAVADALGNRRAGLAPQRHSPPLRLYNTSAASAWFKERGIENLSPTYLRKLRCIGTGPAYQVLNRKPYYTETGMTQYLEERLSSPRRSSSEPEQTPALEPMDHRSRRRRSDAAEASAAE
jgi:hypothetical protein